MRARLNKGGIVGSEGAVLSNDLSLCSAQIQKIAFGLSKGWLNRVKFKIVATEQDLPDYVK